MLNDGGDALQTPLHAQRILSLLIEDPHERMYVTTLRTTRLVRQGEVLFDEGQGSDGLYPSAESMVRLQRWIDGELRMLQFVGPFQWFGELEAIDGLPRVAEAVAARTGPILHLSTDALRLWWQSYPAARDHSLRLITAKLRHLIDESTAQHRLTSEAFLAYHVLYLSRTLVDSDGSPAILLPLTQTDLAALLGVSRQRINQILRQWQASRWISIHYRGMELLDRGALTRLAAGKRPFSSGTP